MSSFASLLWMTEAPEFDAIHVLFLSTEVLTKLQSGSVRVCKEVCDLPKTRFLRHRWRLTVFSASLRGTCYILMSVMRDRPILMLCVGNHGSVLRRYSPLDQLRWALEFSRRAQGRGDAVRGGLSLTGTDPARALLILCASFSGFSVTDWTSRTRRCQICHT